MDAIALRILEDELRKDGEVLKLAAATAQARFSEQSAGRLAAAGFEVNRAYNVLEKAFERICEAFENHFEKRGNYHDKLIERMQLELRGIRPAFLPPQSITAVRELKGFRHIFRHAYDLDLDPPRLRRVLDLLDEAAREFPTWCTAFLTAARALHAADLGE